MKSFFDFMGWTEATSSPCRPELDTSDSDEIKDKEVRECLLIGDKHKTSAVEGVLCLQKRLAYDLEPMALAAGQHGDEGRLRPPHPRKSCRFSFVRCNAAEAFLVLWLRQAQGATSCRFACTSTSCALAALGHPVRWSWT
ncbi:Uncharacterised protein [Bacillus freudenreichii]|nr:Uncharacterised protein [Bacillus freudenreichii]